MVRQKITAYVPPDLADALKRVAAVRDRSISDVVEDAVTKALSGVRGEAEHAALMAKLDAMTRRLGVIERAQETLFEFMAHATRFSMSVAPDIPEADRANVNARGAERFRGLLHAIVSRLGAGKSVLRENFPPLQAGVRDTARANGTHASGRDEFEIAEAAHD
jgi:hypothetical protein